jgi:predicted dehydrogenase
LEVIVASDPKDQHELTRRAFASRLGLGTMAAAMLTTDALRPRSTSAAPLVGNRVIGANDRIVLASIGIRGQGNSLKRGFARLKNVEIKTLCDIDANLADEKINDKRLADVATFKPGFQQDLRRVMEDKDIDAVIIATPNHWHALATIWALQAGKHVYVEKPSSHTVWEGRKMVEAAAKYSKIVQVGTMNRSRKVVQDAIKFIHDGGIGPVYMARGLCFKPRPSIGKYPDGPMKAGETYKLNVESKAAEPLPYTAEYLAKVDYDLWLGPAPKREFNRNRFHYNWHWHWDYGNGDTGNQGPHQFDIARWGLNKNEHPVKIRSVGGYFGAESSQETPDLQTTLYEYADGKVLEFGTRGGYTNPEEEIEIGNIFYGSKGFVTIDGDGRRWQSYFGAKKEKGPGANIPAEKGGSDPLMPTSIESPHYANFVAALRANDPKLLTCDVLEGHMSSTLPHLANISYRVGRALQFDGKTEKFVNDQEADKLLTREYRKGFEIKETS